jgi:hypothetical protein
VPSELVQLDDAQRPFEAVILEQCLEPLRQTAGSRTSEIGAVIDTPQHAVCALAFQVRK